MDFMLNISQLAVNVATLISLLCACYMFSVSAIKKTNFYDIAAEKLTE